MSEEITFTEYIMSCLQKEAMENYWREHYGKEATNKNTDSKNTSTGRKQSTTRTTTKPVS
jgi:hypothetical protein